METNARALATRELTEEEKANADFPIFTGLVETGPAPETPRNCNCLRGGTPKLGRSVLGFIEADPIFTSNYSFSVSFKIYKICNLIASSNTVFALL